LVAELKEDVSKDILQIETMIEAVKKKIVLADHKDRE
jgi:hypothetical protein